MTVPGCTSGCRGNCPLTEVQVVASPGDNLDLASAVWSGPACRPSLDYCIPDAVNPDLKPCVSFRIVGFGEGACDVALTFNDTRPAITIHTEFGPETTEGCCRGNPVIGDTTVTIPPLNGGPDAATDGAGSSDGAASDGLQSSADAPVGG